MTTRLIVAPHADDESLGCGGMLAKYPEECHVVVLSDKGDGRLAEFERAKKVLGYAEHTIAPFATGSLTAESRPVTSWLSGLVRDIKPDILVLPTPGAHQDHIATYESGIRAARFSYTGQAWSVPTVLLYEVPSYAIEMYNTPYPWSRFELLTDAQMDLKAAAIDEYGSQALGTFSPSGLAKIHAQYVGTKFGGGYAEAYAVVRDAIL